MKTISYDDTLYQLVPKEATLEMHKAYRNVLAIGSELDAAMVYRAMLSTAPTPPAQPAEKVANVGCLTGFQFDVEPQILPVSLVSESVERKPLTEEQRSNLVTEHLGLPALMHESMSFLRAFELGIDACEIAHGIKETP